jgi:hypothetical protein
MRRRAFIRRSSKDIAESVCCKHMLQVLQMFQRYIARVLYRCCKSRSRCCTCCNGYTRMIQVYVRNVLYVSDVCCKCFICMLQKYIWMLHIHACCKRMFQVFQVFHTYVACVLSRRCICLQWLHMCFQVFSGVYMCFRRMLQMF